jgi:hypothetical protein
MVTASPRPLLLVVDLHHSMTDSSFARYFFFLSQNQHGYSPMFLLDMSALRILRGVTNVMCTGARKDPWLIFAENCNLDYGI